jgi:hypothetical protein
MIWDALNGNGIDSKHPGSQKTKLKYVASFDYFKKVP